jgi:membrane protein implicated in regulation of membrane protease activity
LAENRYWFARRFPVGDGRNSMAPVSTEGVVVAWVFVGAMLVGALGLLFLGMNGQIVSGIAMFVVLAVAGAGMFIGMSAGKRGDKQHTVDDYKSGRVSNQ